MSELFEKDPQLAAITDPRTQRNLLDPTDPTPLEVDVSGGQPASFALVVANGPEGYIELSISSDDDWLQVGKSRLMLVGGESQELKLTAQPSGDAMFSNLLFSWEGNDETLCQSVIISRKLGQSQSPPTGASAATAPPPRDTTQLEAYIAAKVGTDPFIKTETEYKIFREGGDMEFSTTQVESLLNRICSAKHLTRQTRLTEKLTAMLHEATKDDGVIDQQEYNHVIEFAVRRKMPKNDAREHCVTIILDNAWRMKNNKKLIGKGWFDKERAAFGL